MANTRSVEPSVADAINSQLKSYRLDYKLEQESLNSEIDNALQEYFTKSGGKRAAIVLMLNCFCKTAA